MPHTSRFKTIDIEGAFGPPGEDIQNPGGIGGFGDPGPIPTPGFGGGRPPESGGQGELIGGINRPTFPGIPQFESTPLAPGFLEQLRGLQGLPAFRREALRQGPSPFARLQTQLQRSQELQGLENIRQSSQGRFAEASGALASRGGLSGGARERLGSAAISGGLASEQRLRRAGGESRLGIFAQDEQRRQAALGALPGLELGQLGTGLQAQQFDVSQKFASQQAFLQALLEEFRTEGEIFGAEQLARATEAAG